MSFLAYLALGLVALPLTGRLAVWAYLAMADRQSARRSRRLAGRRSR